jgi:phytoene desaturase (3,4-didehydrolycopene-forming)
VTDDGVLFVYAAENDEAGDRGGTEGKKGFLAVDLVVCSATETILRSETDVNGGRTTGEDDDRSYRETYDWNDELDYSSGVIAFHWSVSRNLEALSTHNVFMSANATSDAERSWASLRGDDDGVATTATARRPSSMVGTPFNFYVHRAGKTDPTACPPGCDSIMVLVPCPALTRDERLASLPRDEAIDAYKRQFGREVVDDARDAVFQRLSVLKGLENLEDSILDEVVDTPGSYADYYNVGAGVPFGLVSPRIWALQ